MKECPACGNTLGSSPQCLNCLDTQLGLREGALRILDGLKQRPGRLRSWTSRILPISKSGPREPYCQGAIGWSISWELERRGLSSERETCASIKKWRSNFFQGLAPAERTP